MRKLFLLLCTVCLVLWQFNYCSLTAAAMTEMEAGVSLYNKRDYGNALGHFILVLRKNPYDCQALYYEALTFHQMKEINLAKNAYILLVKRCPNTPQAQNALKALAYLDPAYSKLMQQGGSTAASGQRGETHQSVSDVTSLSSLPDQVRVPYQREGQNLVVDAYINGRPIAMFFDSGAEATVVFKSQLQNLGMQAPQGPPVTMSYGVGDGGGQKMWLMRANVKAGTLERKNFPLYVQEDAPTSTPQHPLLGETFFKDFSYIVESSPDQTRGTILFQKKGATAGAVANDSSIVPFTNLGKNMLVTVEINGKKMSMIFDTGADECFFTVGQLKSLGITIPDDAPVGTNTGVGGTTQTWRITIPRMRLGPVIKTDVSASAGADGSSGIPYPLLGNSFLGDLRIDVDNNAHQMRIRR